MKVKETINLVNKNVASLAAYHLTPVETDIKLNQNESPFDWPLEAKQKIADLCISREWNRYPNFIPDELKEKIGKSVGLSGDQVIVGNGSNEMLLTIFQSLTSESSKVLLNFPTFTVYNLLASGMGRSVENSFLNDDLSYNVDSILEMSAKDPEGLLIICTPNNPTGSALNKDQTIKILESHKGFVILDQAYIEFGGYNAIELIEKYPNLIITRTFSKAFGGAGIRFGFMLGNSEIISQINKIKLPYNISFMTEAMASIMLDYTELRDERVATLISGRESLIEKFKKLPFEKVYESEANFIIVKLKKHNELFEFLKEESILIRNVSSYPMLDNCLRINVGTDEENSKLLNSLVSFFKEEK
jgi:histidinol-phosphate aminotransferase